MRVAEAKIARMLACTPEELASYETEGKRPPTRAIGVRVLMDDGVTAFWSFTHRTISVTYPGAVRRYKSGGIITDSVGTIEYDEPKKNKGLGVGAFMDAYGAKFALLVLGAIAQVEKENGR